MEEKKTIFKPLSALPIQEWGNKSMGEIIKTIPGNYHTSPKIDLQNTNIEWRWRFIKIDMNMFAEISYKKPNSHRLFINKKNKWIGGEIDKYYDQFVQLIIYHYSK